MPDGLRLTDQGRILGTVEGSLEIEFLPVSITADDGRGGEATYDFEWQISPGKAPDSFLMEYIARDTAYLAGGGFGSNQLCIGDIVRVPLGRDTGYVVDEIRDIQAPHK